MSKKADKKSDERSRATEKGLKTVVIEQLGEFSPAKIDWLAKLIAEYAKAHPELLAEFEKRSVKGGESNGDVDF